MKSGAKSGAKGRAKSGVKVARPKSEGALFLERLEELRSKITAAGQVTERDQRVRELLDAARTCPEDEETRRGAAALLLAARSGLRRGERRAALVFKAAQLDIASPRVVLAEAPEPQGEEAEPPGEEAEPQEPSRAVA